jgi:hypothetical protein
MKLTVVPRLAASIFNALAHWRGQYMLIRVMSGLDISTWIPVG